MELKGTAQEGSEELRDNGHQFNGLDVASQLAIRERVSLFEQWGAFRSGEE